MTSEKPYHLSKYEKLLYEWDDGRLHLVESHDTNQLIVRQLGNDSRWYDMSWLDLDDYYSFVDLIKYFINKGEEEK